jgi:hypothetical protein
MVATCSTTEFRFVGISFPTSGTTRQSSLRSVTSTHSRQSLVKKDAHETYDISFTQRQVRFACETDCDDTSDLLDPNSVYEFENVEPVQPLYLTAGEILKIRADARLQASHFAQAYPNVIAEINHAFENGERSSNHFRQIRELRCRRRRLDPYDVAFQSMDRDVAAFIDEQNAFLVDDDQIEQLDYDDELLDDRKYFCTMRGLESRVSPLFRLNRRMTIRKVLNLQAEMKQSGCSPAQVQMGLRAVCAQASQKACSFALYQAVLDEFEVYNILKLTKF